MAGSGIGSPTPMVGEPCRSSKLIASPKERVPGTPWIWVEIISVKGIVDAARQRAAEVRPTAASGE